MAAVTDIGTMITSSPDIRGGRPRVAGTGMTAMRIAGWYRLGHSPEEIAEMIQLSLTQIYPRSPTTTRIERRLTLIWTTKRRSMTGWRGSIT